MKILKDNYNDKANEEIINPYPKTCVCWGCESELEYEESDMRMGYLGLYYLDCPLCGYENILDDDCVELTKDNVEFPTHFYNFSVKNGAVDTCNNENVKKYISKAIEFLRKNKEEYVWSTNTGNLYVQVHRYDDDEVYEVIVSNDWYETEIPFETKDYIEGLEY